MNFIKRVFKLDADQVKDPFTYIGLGIALIVLVGLFCAIIGSFGVGASWNFIARNARWAGAGWKVAGGIWLAAMVWFDYKAVTVTLKPKINETVQAIIMIGSIALLICINCGFRFDHF